MANNFAPFGLMPTLLNATSYSGKVKMIHIPTSQGANIFIGDPLIPLGTTDAFGVPEWGIATAGATHILGGCFVGRCNGPAGSGVTLTQDSKIYFPASTSAYGYVMDDPDMVYSIQEDSVGGAIAIANAGYSVANLVAGAGGSTSTGLFELDAAKLKRRRRRRHLSGPHSRPHPRSRQRRRQLRPLGRLHEPAGLGTEDGRHLRATMAILVYKLTCAVSGKSYVGITARALDTRWLEHCARARQGIRNSRLAAAMRKYGMDSFTREIVATTDTQDEARSLECAFIRQFDTFANGYNANEGGHGWLVMPEEAKRKSSETQRGRIIPQDTRAKMAAAKMGRSECADHFGDYTQKGAANPRATWFAMSCPDGALRIQAGLRAFAREHELSLQHLNSRGHTKGFYLLDRFYPKAAPQAALT